MSQIRASKENARKADGFVTDLAAYIPVDNLPKTDDYINGRLEFLRNFLKSATDKLPSEASYERERKRRRLPGEKRSEAAARIAYEKRAVRK